LFDQKSDFRITKWVVGIRDYAIVVERMKKGEEEFALQNICGSSDGGDDMRVFVVWLCDYFLAEDLEMLAMI